MSSRDAGSAAQSGAAQAEILVHGIGSAKIILNSTVLSSWDDGLLDMCVGDKRKLTIPPEFGYGDRAVGPIPPGSTLGMLSSRLSLPLPGPFSLAFFFFLFSVLIAVAWIQCSRRS